jgi:hypothetical protein
MRNHGASSWHACGRLLTVLGFLCIGCALKASPIQMYEGAALPKDQVGIVRSGCTEDGGLTIMIVRIDGKDVADSCADFALLPGDHDIEVSGKRLSLRMDTPMIRSGSVLGAPPSPTGGMRDEQSRVIWASSSPLQITCTVRAGEEVIIVGSAGMGPDWQARCQKRAP